MIKTVQEFFGAHGRCREVRLASGRRFAVLLSVEQMTGNARLGDTAGSAPLLRIAYRGRKDELIALGCITRERLASARYGRYEDGPRGGILLLQQEAAPGRRGMIELTYFTQSRAVAGMLPGVRTYCTDWLQALTARPLLRLVVDNTRREPNGPPIERAIRMERPFAIR
jgi:hypothetical protein